MQKPISLLISILLLFAVTSCDKTVFPKPSPLIGEKKMIQMLIDIHIAEGTFSNRKYQDTLLLKSKSEDFYYSVLKKYNVPDSVFEKSYIYYAGDPKKFEKMYRQVVDKLSEMEQFYSGRQNESIELQDKKEVQ